MRRYETICIIKPSVGEDEITAIIDKTTGIIEQFDGSILNLDRWGMKKLAYPIKKEIQGFYVFAEYAGKPEAVAEVERIFKIDDRVLKFMTIKSQEVYVAGPLKAQKLAEAAKAKKLAEEEDDD
ncbi:MAG: 30S ribosomal protein S6 [Desulfobulbaceae bacterium]|nr:30S ribosomal protein S6 [Desulfobulbaceae bacterium]